MDNKNIEPAARSPQPSKFLDLYITISFFFLPISALLVTGQKKMGIFHDGSGLLEGMIFLLIFFGIVGIVICGVIALFIILAKGRNLSYVLKIVGVLLSALALLFYFNTLE